MLLSESLKQMQGRDMCELKLPQVLACCDDKGLTPSSVFPHLLDTFYPFCACRP